MAKILLNLYRRLFARPQWRGFNLLLFHLGLRGLGVLNYESDKISGERYLIRNLLPRLLKNETPVLLDVGANIGDYARSLLASFPKATVYAFEPHPQNYARLEEQTPSDRLKAHNLALGDAPGTLTLYDRADHGASAHASLHEAVISELHKQETVSFTVSVDTLDAFSEREKISHIDFLKIDTEGNELAVLEGASGLLGNGNIGCIHFEFNEMNVVSRSFFRDFRKILPGYALYRLLPGGLLPLGDSPLLTEIFAYQNIIAVPTAAQKKL